MIETWSSWDGVSLQIYQNHQEDVCYSKDVFLCKFMRIMLLVIFCLRIAIFKLVTRYLHNIQQVCLKNIHLFGLQTFQQTFKRNLKQFHQTVWLLALSNWLSQLLKIGRLGYESIFVESVPFNSDLNRFYQLSKHSSIELFNQAESKEWGATKCSKFLKS